MDAYQGEAIFLGPGWDAASVGTPLCLRQQAVGDDEDDGFRQVCQSLLGTAPLAPGSAVHHRNCATAELHAPPLTITQLAPHSTITPPSTSNSASDEPMHEDSAMQLPLLSSSPPAMGAGQGPGRGRTPKTAKKPGGKGATSKRNQRQINLKLLEAGKRLQGLEESHIAAEAENLRLKRLDKNLSACMEHADFQQLMSDIVHKSPAAPQPLPESCSQVSFSKLPPCSEWDATWVSRISRLQPQDYVVLRRQWMQQSAVLLPQALAYGSSSDAHAALYGLHNRHMDLVRALVTLAPGVWLESSRYDMDTLQPVHAPSAEWMRDLMKRMSPPDVLDMLRHIGRDYHSTASTLNVQYRRLLQQYNGLAHRMNLEQLLDEDRGDGSAGALQLAVGSAAAAAWGGGAASDAAARLGFGVRSCHQSVLERRLKLDRSLGYVETLEQLDNIAKLLQDNTSKQKKALLRFFSTCNHGFDPKRIGVLLMLYPLSCTSVDFLPGLLLEDPSGPPVLPGPGPAAPSPTSSPP